MSNLNDCFHGVADMPQYYGPDHGQQDPFPNLGNQDLANIINAAANALRHRGYPPPPPPAFSPMQSHQSQHPHPARPPQQPTQATPLMPSLPLQPPPSGRTPDMWENPKVEQIICAGLKPPYDGNADNLIPTLNLINIRRRNEVWYSATFITQEETRVDLVTQFSKVKEATILQQAKQLWEAPDASTQSHTRGTATYNNRLLGVFLMNSITPDFAALLHSRIDSQYCSDGALLLHTMCQQIHRNHLAFVESIKTKIRASGLTEFNNDIPKYLRFLNSNLKLISSTGPNEKEHNDLIPHILNQLRGTTIPVFQQSILQ